MKDNYLILPGCDDTNRGDQALIWETMEVAKSAGFDGNYYMIATGECGRQSKKVGIESLAYLLPHPSMHAKTGSDNRSYGIWLKAKWTLMSVVDLLVAYPLSKKALRPIAEKFLNEEQKNTLNVFKHAKAAFVKGGGFLHAYGGVTESYKIYFFLYHINLAISMGIPVYFMPNSFGPFKDIISRKLVSKCLKKCTLVYSRESISQQALENSCNIKSLISSDLAMYLDCDNDFDAVQFLKSKGICVEKGRMVGITVRPYRFPGKENADELYSNYKKAVKNLVCWMNDHNYHPVLIEHVFSANFHERDIICINEIVDMLSSVGQHVDVFSDLSLNCKQMKSIYSCMDYLVGTRFHSVIFSLTENVPVIAITYGGNKGDGIMKDIGLSEYAVPIDHMPSNILIDKFQVLCRSKDSVTRKLAENRNRIGSDYNELVSMIRGTVK